MEVQNMEGKSGFEFFDIKKAWSLAPGFQNI